MVYQNEPRRDLQLCLEMLVDGELDDAQRQGLLDHLDRNPQLWRKCALTFMNEQVLKEELRPHAKPPQLKTSYPNTLMLHPMNIVVACLALVTGFVSHAVIGSISGRDRPTAQSPSTVLLQNDDGDGGALTPVSFVDAFAPNSLLEIENTPERAVYFVDNHVPEFLLEAIILAGHSVEFKQDSTTVTAPNGQVLQVPFNRMEIEKYANLTY